MHETGRDYERIAARFWNLPQKGEEEARREQAFMDVPLILEVRHTLGI